MIAGAVLLFISMVLMWGSGFLVGAQTDHDGNWVEAASRFCFGVSILLAAVAVQSFYYAGLAKIA